MICLDLFLSFLLTGALTFGGGYAALPLIREQCVTVRGWLTDAEFASLTAISEITPGPISINSATYVGMKTAGVPGAICATLGFILIPFIIVTILFLLYRRFRTLYIMQGILTGLRPAVTALIASAGLTILISALTGTGSIEVLPAVLFAAALVVLFLKRPNPIFVIIGCGVLGGLTELTRNLLSAV